MGRNKLTFEQVQEIRLAHAESALSGWAFATRHATDYGLHPNSLQRIVAYRSWTGALVDVAPLRTAVEHSGVSLCHICCTLGWNDEHRGADVTRLRRALGMSDHTRYGRRYRCQRIGYDHALRIAQAIGVDPVDVGC